ncbi:alcohol dehydrogenase [Caballeronia arationis]|jgi:NADPH2:quinone reductase|uniref:NADPH2:quinone reductase n=1 Tax=Caballeronia arationis TaxID=1777142 RepID=A0A7Z7N836_9BURK|nr:NADPH:quinone oxidoreductase family protein [Caballeronia arationis]SAL03113.1 alcohol dehydrogenase [Caballeronia arationis]SOE91432.1 NADPH2:quinone reductase [Caballeronia arationis]
MKALVVRKFGEPEDVDFGEIADPVLGDDSVLINVHSAAINYPDLLVIRGHYQNLPPLPFAPGKDAAGVVLAVGPAVRQIKPGDRVVAQMEYGAYASRVAVPEANCESLPEGMSFDDAVAIGLPFQTAYFALCERGRFVAGETVLVTGASGGVGAAALQLVRALGGKAIAAVNRPEQAAQALADGASHVVDLSMPDIRESLRRQVLEATGGHGADIVLDALGGDVFGAGLRALAWRGRGVVIGFASGEIPQIKANYLLVKNIEVSGLQWSDYRDRMPQKVKEVQRKLNELHVAGQIRARVALKVPLESGVQALMAVERRAVAGRAILRFE